MTTGGPLSLPARAHQGVAAPHARCDGRNIHYDFIYTVYNIYILDLYSLAQLVFKVVRNVKSRSNKPNIDKGEEWLVVLNLLNPD